MNNTSTESARSRTVNADGCITEHDIYLFKQGTHTRLARKLGAHPAAQHGVNGVHFAVWAPNANAVSVIGDFNAWDRASHAMNQRADGSGIWECFVPGIGSGACYKYHIVSQYQDYRVDKADPYAMYSEVPPRTGSRVWDMDYTWHDNAWMARRHEANALDAPMSIYEVHLGSWRRVPEEGNRFLTYSELAGQLVDYVRDLGFTHVEFMPLTEHPFYGSWGYQTSAYFAPTARHGTPQELMALIDRLHQAGIGVILDWVPSHFPGDQHGLAYFDGTCLYEHADPRQGRHPEWNSAIFNYGRNEVRAFLMSSALFWLGKYHADGLRVDGVASMLYLDYGRSDGDWIPNEHGGRENLAAMQFLRDLNKATYHDHPDTMTIAEESTAWPMVSRPGYVGGLGFGMKWNMGWMHDTLQYFQQNPVFRKYHHDHLTFGLCYAFSENFILPLSHDEVVHGKGALIGKMPGDEWQQFANLRLLYGYMWGHPGKQLLFMGGEFGQKREWQHDESLEWHVLQFAFHSGMQRWVGDLNRCYRKEAALYQKDFTSDGFSWVDFHDREESVISYLRHGYQPGSSILVVCNFTPVVRHNYVVGVPCGGYWREILNSDATIYGGSGVGNFGGVEASPVGAQGHFHSLSLTLPPLAVVYFSRATDEGAAS